MKKSVVKYGLVVIVIIFFTVLGFYFIFRVVPMIAVENNLSRIVNRQVIMTVNQKKAWQKKEKHLTIMDAGSENDLNRTLRISNKHFSYSDMIDDMFDERSGFGRELPTVKTFGKDVLYIKLPTFFANDENFEKKYVKTVAKPLIQSSKKFIVIDLRKNQGGYREPMILSVSPLLNDGTLFRQMYKNGEVRGVILKGKKLTINEKHLGNGVVTKTLNPNNELGYTSRKTAGKSVIVLVGGKTASAAENTLLSLKNNPKVIVVGKKTGGFTSVNAGKGISIGGHLNIPVAWLTDNSGHVYRNTPIYPDRKNFYINGKSVLNYH